jgi:peptide/nickel transport system permease protein
MSRVGAVIVGLAVCAAIFGPALAGLDPAAQQLPLRLEGPSLAHWFGLDELGRDILARVLSGARISLLVGTVVVSISAGVGILMGAIAGYFGGAIDEGISRVIDILLAFPGLLLAIALVAVLGPSLTNVVFALASIGWVGYARLVRGQVLRAREFEFVQAARALGATTPRVLVHHIIPTTLPAVTVQATLGMGGAILAEASLSFLGLGVQPPTPSWGTMLNGGRLHLLDAPHLTIFPGLAIAILVLGFNFLGDGLRDAIDPVKARSRR